MLVKLNTQQTQLCIKDDPVRPHISAEWRCRPGRMVYALDGGAPWRAVICCAVMDEVPTCEADMKWPGVDVAVFYTVWSYDRGAGREIVREAQREIHRKNPYIKRFVTLSPLTEMAEQFHLRNGAVLLDRHSTCQNFEYHL